jgi:hypothetical protein
VENYFNNVCFFLLAKIKLDFAELCFYFIENSPSPWHEHLRHTPSRGTGLSPVARW